MRTLPVLASLLLASGTISAAPSGKSGAQAQKGKRKTGEKRSPPAASDPAPAAPRPAAEEPRDDLVEERAPASLVREPGAGGVLPLAIVLGFGAHVDDGTMRGTERRSIQITRQRDDFSNRGLLFGSAALLFPRSERLRLGVATRYFGDYDLRYEKANRDSTLGQLVEALAVAEYALPIQERTHLLLGAEAGLGVLFPGGDLEDDIERLQSQGAGVWNLPRIGYTVGPALGGRYRLAERVAVRLDLGAAWTQTFLFFTDEDVGGISFAKRSRVNVIRYRLGLSLEVPL